MVAIGRGRNDRELQTAKRFDVKLCGAKTSVNRRRRVGNASRGGHVRLLIKNGYVITLAERVAAA